jgi:DNA-binding beta-propeller fold protein YncE
MNASSRSEARSHAQDDDIYVTDTASGTVLKFDLNGNQSVVASGLNSPAGLAFDKSGQLYVANAGSGTVVKFDSSAHQSVFASGLNNPAGLAFAGIGELYVANTGAGTIEKIASTGARSVFASGLSTVRYLAVHDCGHLYASTLRTIEKFDSTGSKSTIFNTLNDVYGIAFAGGSDLYAGLQNSGSIVKVSAGGGTQIITFSDPVHAFPAGLAFQHEDKLYVVFGQTIRRYDLSGGDFLFASGLTDSRHIAVRTGHHR